MAPAAALLCAQAPVFAERRAAPLRRVQLRSAAPAHGRAALGHSLVRARSSARVCAWRVATSSEH
jgi:hypothetical protein